MAARIISVFGSSAPRPGSEAYGQAQRLGMLLARQGFIVATGGYGGTMAAVSQGAAEAGGHVIGVTCGHIEQYRPMPPNDWVAEEVRYPSAQERLLHLVQRNDAMIAVPGGIGTLSEMALAWSLLQTGAISPRPLVLMGGTWRETLHAFVLPEYVRSRDLDLLYFASGPDTAVAHIRQSLAGR